MHGYNLLTLDKGALQTNIGELTKRLPKGGRLMAMVKGNGYGVGATLLAKELQECGISILGLSHLDEAVQLRKEGITGPLFVLSAPPYELKKAVTYDLEVALSTAEEVLTLGKLAKEADKRIKVHLHIDTGMKRFGCIKEKSKELCHLILHTPSLIFEGCFSHLVAPSSPSFDEVTERQIATFFSIADNLPAKAPYLHIASSAALRRFANRKQNMARVGLALFGCHSTSEESLALPLTPALTLTTRLCAIQECYAGEGIGYFHAAIMRQKKGKVGIIPFGYHDGMPTTLTQEAYLTLKGKRAPILGKICMDFTLLDLTHIPEAKVGDQVIIFDAKERCEQLANWAKCNVRELLCCLGPRVKRRICKSEKQVRATSCPL